MEWGILVPIQTVFQHFPNNKPRSVILPNKIFSSKSPLTCRLMVYSFGHLKSAKYSENGMLRREKFQLPKEWEF